MTVESTVKVCGLLNMRPIKMLKLVLPFGHENASVNKAGTKSKECLQGEGITATKKRDCFQAVTLRFHQTYGLTIPLSWYRQLHQWHWNFKVMCSSIYQHYREPYT